MLRRFLSIIIVFAIAGATSVYAQTGSESQVKSGTVYSKIGVGFPVDLGSSAADGMGLSGVSFIEPFVPGLANPAQWGSTVYGLATGGVGLQNFDARDNQSSSSNALFSANYFQAQFPLIRDKLGVSAAVAPYTQSSFRFVEIDSRIINSGGTTDTLNYRGVNNSDGGVNMVELGFGWKINSSIYVGYAGSLVFASIDNEFTTDFDNPEFTRVNFTRQTSGIGFGNRFGVLFNASDILGGNDQISLGASVTLPVTLDAEKTEETDKTLANGRIQTIVLKEGEGLGDGSIELPLMVNGGITYQPSRLFSISTEGLYQEWSQYSSDFNVEDEQLLTDRYKLGMGFRYFPYIRGSNRFFSKFKYRLGASYDAGHLKLEGQRIETFMFSFGLGILSPRSRSSVDLSFQYGIRGTKDQNLIKENIWGLRLSVNLAELMFFRPKLQ